MNEMTLVADLVAEGVLRVEDGNHGEYRPRPHEFVDDGTPFIRAADMTTGVIMFATAGRIDETARARIRKGVGQPGDALLSHKGTVGKVAVAPMDSPDYVCSPQTTFWRSTDPTRIEQRYLPYVLKSPAFRAQLNHLMGQTDMAPYVSLTDQRAMSIPVPPIEVQRGIAEVLGGLDDKIAANAQFARTADDLVRGWFVATTLAATSVTTVGALAEQPRALTEPETVDPITTYVGLEHVPRRMMWLDDFGVAETVSSTKAAFREGDVLFGKLRPYFHKVVAAPTAGICSTDIMVLRARESSLEGFVLAAVSSDKTVERCAAASEGTRMPRTNWKDLSAVEVPWPGEGSATELSSRAVSLRRRVDSCYRESANLAQLRDTLLPHLMSGKIRVKDAERVVEGVV